MENLIIKSAINMTFENELNEYDSLSLIKRTTARVNYYRLINLRGNKY